MLQGFGTSNIGYAVMCLLALICFCLQILYGLWHLKLIIAYYRSNGLTAEEAKAQALQGMVKSGVGQAVAKEAIRSSIV
jgi:hypothetical protein